MHQSSNNLSSKVEIFISVRNLKNKDVKAFCVIFMEHKKGHFDELGRTSKEKKNLNPNWPESFLVDYLFEEEQRIRFQVFDYHKDYPAELGNNTTTLGELASRGTSVFPMNDEGSLVVRVQDVNESRDSFVFSLRGIGLDKKDTFGKSDPYLIFYKKLANNQWIEIFRTEVIFKTLDPVWMPFELSEHNLCDSDRSKKIRVECFDYDKVGSHEIIGTFEVTCDELLRSGSRFNLFYAKKKRNAGIIEVCDVLRKKNFSFFDFLKNGLRLSLSVAVDFSSSNGDPTKIISNHSKCITRMSDYELGIKEIGEVLQEYDIDKYFAVFGFGAIPKNETQVNHCFPLTGDPSNPFVVGLEGILKAYDIALSNVQASEPTYLHQVINQTIQVARNHPPHEMYHVLLILTDGQIMDIPETISSIVEASHLPISIMIVGIGVDAFASLNELQKYKKNLKIVLEEEQQGIMLIFKYLWIFQGSSR